MAADINTAAALVIAAGYNTPAVMEQIGNYVLTKQGKNDAGINNTAKYVSLLPTYNVVTYGTSFIALGVVTAVDLEQVNNIALIANAPVNP